MAAPVPEPGENSSHLGPLRILVCGGRDYADFKRVYRELNRVYHKWGVVHVVAGDATGADFYALLWSQIRGIKHTCYYADWKGFGRAAGPLRNARMLGEGRPDLVIAFPGGAGTADMVRRARAAGVLVHEIEREIPPENKLPPARRSRARKTPTLIQDAQAEDSPGLPDV